MPRCGTGFVVQVVGKNTLLATVPAVLAQAMTWHSLIFIENPRHFDVIAIPAWDILEEIFAWHGRLDLVCPHYAANIGGFAGRRYIRCVHFVKKVEIVDDGGKLLAEGPGFFFINSQANQKGNILYQFSIYDEGWRGFIR